MKNPKVNGEKGVKQLSVRLQEDVIQDLKDLAEDSGITATSALQKAIATEKYIRSQIQKGAKILVKDGDDIREIVFR